MSNANNAASQFACFQEYALINHGAGNKVKKRLWELTLEECRQRTKVHEAHDCDDDYRILTLKLGKKVLSLEQVHQGCTRLRVPRGKVVEMRERLLDAVKQGLFDDEITAAQQLQKRR
ncbi:hypothetical protein [Shewanella waksmanii]|uniref:hypothetical protein n=1 Tax=Shewanella waksmanii TaxID=213783 RepID=UPI00373665FD